MIEVDPNELREKRNRENRKKLTGLLEKIEGCSVSDLFICVFSFYTRPLDYYDPLKHVKYAIGKFFLEFKLTSLYVKQEELLIRKLSLSVC